MARRISRTNITVVAALLLAALAGGTAAVMRNGTSTTVGMRESFVDAPGGPTSTAAVRIDTTLYIPSTATRQHPAPAVVVSPGFGESKRGVDGDARALAAHGYVVLTWSLRGFGRSLGKIALTAPDTEVRDLSLLLDRLARTPEVLQDSPGDPRVGLTGQSYGGGISLMGASDDKRVDAIVPVITWNNLNSAFLPGGVFKAQYASVFFASGPGEPCSRFAQRVCDAYTRLAQTGTGTAADRALLAASSPDPGRITAPTLLVQGQNDTLFPLQESLTTARTLQARGTPVALAWLNGGHDQPFGTAGDATIRRVTRSWFDHYLRHDTAATVPVFQWDRSTGGTGTSTALPDSTDSTDRTGRTGVVLPLQGPATQPLANPAGGRPASISSVPGAGRLGGLSSALGLEVPGQTATWQAAPLAASRELLGDGHLTVHVASSNGTAVLFAKIYDVSPYGSAALPGGQVTPLRLDGLSAGGRDVTITLPALAHVFPAGHRIRVSLSSTDLAYAGPTVPATYTANLEPATALALPLVPVRGGGGLRSLGLVASLIAAGVALLTVVLLLRHRRGRGRDLGSDAAPPIVIRGLAKSYADGFRAVDGVDLVVERGQVLGLLGPNGAGKTTTLRMLAGLISPTEGEVQLFGRPVRSGAPVLSRVGLFVEGPGLLPHLSGLANLQLYWTSTAPSMDGSHIDEVLQIAGLGDAVHRPVRTYSQGMRQRLAIAQAMLGLPDLLVLDEPTNGLDPPQIKEVREVIGRIAATGRTVLVSSHLLAEVEQTCTHVAVMNRGKVVASGTVEELLADDGTVRVDVDDPSRGLAAVRDLPGVTTAVIVDASLQLELDGTSRQAIVAALVHAGVGVRGLASRRRLEDVFLELLGAGTTSSENRQDVNA